MIDYNDGYFNIATLFRVNGSASYKALGFALISTAIYIILGHWVMGYFEILPDPIIDLSSYDLLDHPYPVAVIISSFLFVLSAKVTLSYNRYWEACTAVHNMQSKWLDAGSTMAAFHMQSKAYERIQPPSFGDQPHLGGKKTVIPPCSTFTSEEEESNASIKSPQNCEPGKPEIGTKPRSIHASPSPKELPFPEYTARSSGNSSISTGESKQIPPTLFVQEAAHLVSLLSAVALSTLRCGSDEAESPLVEFVPGRPWPHCNSDDDSAVKSHRNRCATTAKYLCDASRTAAERRRYNADRPFSVVGGVSAREARALGRARGAAAKTALAYLWVNEFLLREQLRGAFGAVAPPIVSRLPQFLSDGHLWYGNAQKIARVPFPFPHAQMATLWVHVCLFLIPVLLLAKVAPWFGLVLNFLTVLLLAGLNELSKELESPFRGIPNDLPLNLFQAQFNEAIITMFSGFHPDSWWEVKGDA